MFSRKYVYKLNISKIVRPLLAALSVNGLKQTARPLYKETHMPDQPRGFDQGCDTTAQ